ncbi:MAG: LysR family transcriptional regulator [Caulobacteraceae bacterium]|nr:LysR family transcriptional regulator [Caulobacteraceae bacterium]
MTLAPFDLNLRHLRALSAVVERGSVSAAAQAVNLSQPALTQGLAKLERQLGVRLFERRSDGVSPTPAGEGLARRSAAAIGHLTAAANDSRRGGRGFARPEHLMTAGQLQAYLSLADGGSFVAAATASGLSQPTMHRAVRDLEQVCGLVLVERRGRGVVLTPDGRRIARGARLAKAEIAAGIIEVGASPETGGRIVIGAMPLSRALVIPAAIAAFVRENPQALIEVIEGSWRELIEPLRDGVIDFMIGALRDQPPAFVEQQALSIDHLAIIGRAGHPLAGPDDPGREALGRHGWIVGPRETPIRNRWEAMFAGQVLPAAPIECGSVMVIRGVLQASDLLTLLSHDQVALEIDGGMLATIGPPLDGQRTLGVTTRIGWRPTPAQSRLLTELERAAQQTRLQENK